MGAVTGASDQGDSNVGAKKAFGLGPRSPTTRPVKKLPPYRAVPARRGRHDLFTATSLINVAVAQLIYTVLRIRNLLKSEKFPWSLEPVRGFGGAE
jgi:hypothetical protein